MTISRTVGNPSVVIRAIDQMNGLNIFFHSQIGFSAGSIELRTFNLEL